MDPEDGSVEMAYALYEVLMNSNEADIVRVAAAALFNTEAGRLFMRHNPVTL